MSEDILSIICKVDKRSPQKIDSINQCISDFCVENQLGQASTYYQKNNLVNRIDFFDTDKFDEVDSLLCQLSQYSKSNPVAKYEFDTVNEILFYAVTNKEMRVFDTLKDAMNTKHIEHIAAPPDLDKMGLEPKKMSFIELSYIDSKKDSITDYFKSICDNDREDFEANFYKYKNVVKASSFKVDEFEIYQKGEDWQGQMEALVPYIRFVYDKGGDILIGIDMFEQLLFPNYPSDDELAEEIEQDRKQNKEEKEKHIKAMKEQGLEPNLEFYVDDFDNNKQEYELEYKSEMLTCKLIDSVDVLLNNCLLIQGITYVAASFRHHSLKRYLEVYSEGSKSDGLYVCGLESLSNIRRWIKT